MEKFFNNLKITSKLMVMLAISIIFFIIFVFAFFLQLTSQEHQITAIFNNRLDNYETYSKIHNDILDVQVNLFQMISWANANYQNSQIIEVGNEQKSSIEDTEKLINEYINLGKITPEERQLYQELLTNLLDYKDWALSVIDMVGKDIPTATMFMSTANDKFILLKGTLQKLKIFENNQSKTKYNSSVQQSILIFIIVVAAFIAVLMSISLYTGKIIIKPLQNVINIIKRIVEGDFTNKVEVDTGDEIGEMAGYFNILEEQIRDLLKKIKESSIVLINAIQGLSVSSKEISATSTQQSAGVKEIVTTMEDSNILSHEMSKSISEVVKIALQTKSNVEIGVSYVKNSLSKMEEIKNKNMDTIHGIRLLGEKIENIWDIVNIINGIVDQTKIIAFNAALEASSASEGGKNFQIVASEIKRLADNTMTSTKEIKAKINEIQRSSNNLIIISEDGTERIKEGWELSQNLEAVFGDILNSAEISAKSSENIELSIKQQASAFEQILLTLKEISSGIENFVYSTKQTSQTTETLKEIADGLNKTVENYRLE